MILSFDLLNESGLIFPKTPIRVNPPFYFSPFFADPIHFINRAGAASCEAVNLYLG